MIAACLATLTSQTYPRDRLEIIVADGGSTDDTRGVVATIAVSDSRIRLVENPDRNAGGGMNAGIKHARGSVVGAISAHSVPAPDYVERAVEALERTGAWAVGGIIERAGRTPVQRAIARATASPFGVGNSSYNYLRTGAYVEGVFPGMWPRWVFDRVGPFDSTVPTNEDNELSHRILEAGGRIWLEPSVSVVYEPRDTWRGVARQYRAYALGRMLVFRKHPSSIRWRHLAPAALVGGMFAGAFSGFVDRRLWLLTLAAAATYLGVLATAARRMRKEGDSTVRILFAMVLIHQAYGLGTWEGLFRFSSGWLRRPQSGPAAPREPT
jgi:succinoglycan biosynthesis protein ExoA